MRITQKKLQQIIKEEVTKILAEQKQSHTLHATLRFDGPLSKKILSNKEIVMATYELLKEINPEAKNYLDKTSIIYRNCKGGNDESWIQSLLLKLWGMQPGVAYRAKHNADALGQAEQTAAYIPFVGYLQRKITKNKPLFGKAELIHCEHDLERIKREASTPNRPNDGSFTKEFIDAVERHGLAYWLRNASMVIRLFDTAVHEYAHVEQYYNGMLTPALAPGRKITWSRIWAGMETQANNVMNQWCSALADHLREGAKALMFSFDNVQQIQGYLLKHLAFRVPYRTRPVTLHSPALFKSDRGKFRKRLPGFEDPIELTRAQYEIHTQATIENFQRVLSISSKATEEYNTICKVINGRETDPETVKIFSKKIEILKKSFAYAENARDASHRLHILEGFEEDVISWPQTHSDPTWGPKRIEGDRFPPAQSLEAFCDPDRRIREYIALREKGWNEYVAKRSKTEYVVDPEVTVLRALKAREKHRKKYGFRMDRGDTFPDAPLIDSVNMDHIMKYKADKDRECAMTGQEYDPDTNGCI